MNNFLSRRALVAFIFSWALIETSTAQLAGTARTYNGPTIQGTVDGHVQQMTGTTANINGSGAITGDLLVPGTPTFIKNGSPTFGGIIVGTGSTSPSGYSVILNGNGARLGHLRTRTNPIAIPAVPAVPAPTGTRTVTITSAGQSTGNFATLRNLTLNGNVGQYVIPAGTYGDFVANGACGFTLGVAGATQPAVYNFQHLTFNGATNIVVLGPVVINVANGFTANGAAGTSTNPTWLKINVVAGGFTVNGGCTLYSYVNAPAGTLTINGNAKLTGGAISKDLTVNANGLLKLFDSASFENHPPVAANQSVTTAQDTAKAIVLSATDADGQALTYSIVAQPGHGSLSGTPPQVTYTPTHGYYGADSFTFKANDGQADSNVATVSITVTHVNHAPVANAGTLTLNQGTSGAVVLTGSDVDNDPLTFRVTTAPAHGALSGTPPNLTYTPAQNYYGPDSFRFVANDGAVDSATATVSITVNHVNHPPIASGQNVTTNEDTALSILLSATDVDSDPLIYTTLTSPAHGTLSGAAPNLTYTPTAHFFGSDSFTFRANDGSANSNTATFQITVVHVNHPPTANGQNVSLDEDTTKAIVLTGADPDGDTITFSISSPPQHGTLSGAPPNVVYTPALDYFGGDSFAFRTNDGAASSQNGLVNLTVRPVNDAPTVQISAPASGAQFDAGDTVHITATALDKDGTIATFRILFDGSVVYEGSQTSTAAYDVVDVSAGQHTISAVVIDNEGASGASAQVPINVRSQGNGPVQVNAGPDRLISLPATAHLDGSVTVNGAPAGPNVQTAWQKNSGPGNATFDNSAALNPMVTFGAPGVYVLKLVATAPEGTGFDTVKVTVLAAPVAGPDSPVSNQGREFWMAFLSGLPAQYEPDHAGAFLFISSEVNASGTVEIFQTYQIDGGWQTYRDVKNFTVAAGGKALVEVSGFWQPVYDNQYDQALHTAVHIVADAPVAVHALSSSDYSTDGSLVLPNGLLGRDYYVMSYRNSPQFPGDFPHVIGGTELAIVGTRGQTQVTITPTASTAAHPAGQPFTVTLQQGEVYRMINKTDVVGDFTGTRVQSDKPVAVFGGHACAPVPAATPACDHLFEQIPPVDFWGRHFVTMPLKTRTGGDRFRMLAAYDNTHVSVNGEIVATINRGQFYETVLAQPSAVIADQAILLAQYAQSSFVDHTTGDPFLMFVPPYETFGHRYILSTQKIHSYYHGGQIDIFDSYLSLIIASAHIGEVQINGQPIAAAQFAPIGESGFSGASIAVPKDTVFDISAPVPVGAWIYGWASYESYGFTGGMYGSIDSATAQFTLTQSAAAEPIGRTHHVRAQLTGASGVLIQGARVDFAVTGANPTNGSGSTAADGSVEFFWQGAQAGTDTVTATAGGLTASVTVTWLSNTSNQPPIVNAGPDVVIGAGQSATLNGLVQDDGLPAGGQLTVQWSSMPGLGDVVFANPNAAQTTATFAMPGQYRLRLTGFDGQFAGDDDMLVVVDSPPRFDYFQTSPESVDVGSEWSVTVVGIDPDGVVAKIELLDGAQVVAMQQTNEVRSTATLTTVLNTIGIHTMTVRLTDDFGMTADRSVNVNVRPRPVVQLLSPPDGTSIAAGDSTTFTASASSTGGAITQVVYVDVTDWEFTIGEGTGPNYSFTWTPSYSGTFQIAARAYDEAGATGISAPITVTVQSPGDPTIVITNPQDGSSIYRDLFTIIHADASAFSPATVDTVYFYDGNDYLGYDYSPPYELQWYAGSSGAHTLRAEVYDTFGGYATTSVTVNVIDPPDLTVALVQPPPNIPVKVNTPTTLAATIDGLVGAPNGVYFVVNNEDIGDGSSNYVTWTPTAVGDYLVEVYAYGSDPWQEGYAAATVTVADLHSPEVQWIAPVNNASFAPNTPIGLQAHASDVDANLSKLQFFADGQLLSETAISGGAGVASFSWDNAGPGWHALTALATDDTLQNGGAFLRIFVERTIASDLLPPSGLTSEATSPNNIHLAWSASVSPNAVATAIERRIGVDGVWEEIATVDATTVTYEDSSLESETYYSYRLASLNEAGARSMYSEESSATTLVSVPQYAVIDLGEDLVASGQAAQWQSFSKQSMDATRILDPIPIDIAESEAKSISDTGDVLLKVEEGNYRVWRLNGTPATKQQSSFTAYRITRDGIITGSVDHSHESAGGNHIYEARAALWGIDDANPVEITPEVNRFNYPQTHASIAISELEGYVDSHNYSALIWDNMATDRNATGSFVGEAGVVFHSTPGFEGTPYDIPLVWGKALLWSGSAPDASYSDLGSLANRSATPNLASRATAINDAGAIVGYSVIDLPPKPLQTTYGNRTHAFRSRGADIGDPNWTFNNSTTGMQDLGVLADGWLSNAWDINTQGVIVGTSTTQENTNPALDAHACVWEPDATQPTRLPDWGVINASYPYGFSYALDINDRNQIVGMSLRPNDGPDQAQHPFLTPAVLWQKNANTGASNAKWEKRDLNDQISDKTWYLTKAVAINKDGLIVGMGWHSLPINPNDPSQGYQPPVRRAFLLLPIELKQLNYPTSTGTTDLGPSRMQTISAGDVAYITGTPEMPRLEATIASGTLTGRTVEWHLEVKSERPERGTKDDLTMPQTDETSVVEVASDQPWKIYDYYIAPADFFGGKCKLFFRLRNTTGYLTEESNLAFTIRGKNPRDADAKRYLQATAGTHRYAWAMAQHESRQLQQVYNQFNPGGSTKELPNFSGNYPDEDGWGMAQLDRPLGISASTSEVYSWQSNSTKFYAELNLKKSDAERFIRWIRNRWGRDSRWEEPPASWTISSSSFTPVELATIVLYNGASGIPTCAGINDSGDPVTFRSPWTFDPTKPAGHRWDFHDNTNPVNNLHYATTVIQDEWQGGLPTVE